MLRKEVFGMDVSSIGAASVEMHLAQTINQVSITMLKKAMDMTENQSAALIETLNAANPVSFGHALDTYA